MDFTLIANKLDKISDQISDMRVEQARLNVLWEENKDDWRAHMKRTAVSEDRLDMVEKELADNKSFKRGLAWAMSAVAGVVSAVASFIVQFFLR